MSSYKTPPSFISASKSYSQWTTEINVWNDVTEIPGATFLKTWFGCRVVTADRRRVTKNGN